MHARNGRMYSSGLKYDVIIDLRKILPECQQMANVPDGVETLPKISIASRVHERYRRQTTDGLEHRSDFGTS